MSYEMYYRNSSHSNVTCPFVNCVSCDAVIMDGWGCDNMTLDDITRDIPLLYGINEITRLNSTTDGLVFYIKLPNQQLGACACAFVCVCVCVCWGWEIILIMHDYLNTVMLMCDIKQS